MTEDAPSSSSSDSAICSLHQHLISCSRSIETRDYIESDRSASELVNFLNSALDSAAREAEDEEAERNAFQILTEIHRFTSSPSLSLEVLEALSFELPKSLCRAGCTSKRCSDLAECFIDNLVEKCSPREILSILCDALSSPEEQFRTPLYYAPLLSGIAKVLMRIQRRQFEQVKSAVPVVLNVLKYVALEMDDEDPDADYVSLFLKAIDIANSIQAVFEKLEQMDYQKLQALFGLFILQLMALVSLASRARTSHFLPIVIHLSHFLPFCGLSYIGLITGCDVDRITNMMVQEVGEDDLSEYSHAKLGASLTVIWGSKFEEAAIEVKKELQNNPSKRFETVGMLGHVFSCAHLSWDLKSHALDFLHSILDGCQCHDCFSHITSLHSGLVAIQFVIMTAPSAAIRKSAYEAFNKVLGDIPSSPRFDILQALVKRSSSSSMIGILLDRVRREMLAEYSKRSTIFWDGKILDLVEQVLKPPAGGPPSLPECTDAVVAALNLYRFALITESSGNSNHTGVLSKERLEKALHDWFLPLRALVAGITTENQADCDQLASDMICSLNPLALVLYRCIELVEERM